MKGITLDAVVYQVDTGTFSDENNKKIDYASAIVKLKEADKLMKFRVDFDFAPTLKEFEGQQVEIVCEISGTVARPASLKIVATS